jgi:Protein of unknown function (DUF1822)
MNTNKPDISKFIATSSEHGWIDLNEFPEYPIDDNTTPVDLNLRCKSIITEWLQEYMGLPSKEDFPYSGLPERDRLVSQIVNGFCLKIETSKVIFIPSEQIDISSFEVAQEWVDLTNWMGDYYVPIQVDVDAQHLHLWGMITHQELKQVEEPDDKKFRYYNVDADRTIDNLEVLWTSCELAPDPRSENIPKLVTQGIGSLIDRVKSEAGSNFDRLILQFNEWGAILNDPQYLSQYLQPLALVNSSSHQSRITVLSQIFSETTRLIYQEWKTFEEYFSSPQPAIAFRRGTSLNLRLTPNNVRGVALDTPENIDRAIKKLYGEQKSKFPIVELPNHIQQPSELLPYLIQNTNDERLSWKALEYLWTIEPNHQLAYRLIKDLGIVEDRQLALVLGITKKKQDELSLRVKVYPVDNDSTLPPNLQLLIVDEYGNFVNTEKPIISGTSPLSYYIELNFRIKLSENFSIVIKLNDTMITEDFMP